MEFAIVENSIVINIAKSDTALDSNWIEITPATGPAKKGDTWNGTTFERTVNVEKDRKDKLKELKAEAELRSAAAGPFSDEQQEIVSIVLTLVKDGSLDKNTVDTDQVKAVEAAHEDAVVEVETHPDPYTYNVVTDPNWP